MQELIHIRGKLLGVDFGDKRTGLAVSDEGQRMASGICQIQVGGMQKTAEETARIARERSAVGIVVGLPVNMDGSHGPRSAHAEKFARLLAEASGLPVALLDERMTTMAASRYLNETDTRGKRRKNVIDTLSAEIILQNALDKLRQQGVYADLPLYSYVAAVSVGVVHETPVCDLDYLEDSGGEVDFNFVMDDESNIIELQGTGEERPFSKRELDEMYLLAEGGIKQLIAAQKRAVGHLFR